MSIGQRQTASGRPLRVAPAWVGAAQPVVDDQNLPVRDAVWIWSVRRYARIALWALPLGAVLHGWSTLATPPGHVAVRLAAAWFFAVAMIALAGLLAGSRARRTAVVGLLLGLTGVLLQLPLTTLPAGVSPAGLPLDARHAALVAAAVVGAGWLLLGWAVFRAKLVNPADGVLLMLAAICSGAGSYAVRPLPTVGALLLLAAGMGLAWTGHRLIPPA